MREHFSVDARTLLTLGRESIKDHTTAVLELVKNSYDAGAKRVEIEIKAASSKQSDWLLRVADDGCGMTLDDVRKSWLRIGFSAKRTAKTVGRRRKTGEKGIGRLSADRLGATLEMRTRAVGAEPVVLKVSWDSFDAPGTDLNKVPVDVSTGGTKPRIPSNDDAAPNAPGTELLIGALRQRWTVEDVSDLYDELAILTPPTGSAPDFALRLLTDVDGAPSGDVRSTMNDLAEIDLTVEVSRQGDVSFEIFDRNAKGDRRRADKGSMDWAQFLQRTKDSARANPRFGTATVRLMFFPRHANALRGTKLSLSELRGFLDTHAGVRIYRDGIRVQPYGNIGVAEGDWLALSERKTREPAGKARPTWRVSANQLVGAAFVGRDQNPKLVDSSSREGLVHNEAYEDLCHFVVGVVRLLESHYHEVSKAEAAEAPQRPAPLAAIAELGSNLAEVQKSLRHAARTSSERTTSRVVERSLQQLTEAVQKAKVVRTTVDELENQNRIYRGLASIGIAAAVFGHETQGAIALFTGATRNAITLLEKRPDEVERAISELQKALSNSDRVSAWGQFALARVRRDKRRRRRVDIAGLARSLIAEMAPVFSSATIELRQDINAVSGTTFAIDIEAVLINLLTNAYTACLQTRRSRVVRIEVKAAKHGGKEGVHLRVADSGPGIASKFRERIWEPLFTTKTAVEGAGGTGLGLTIVQSVVEEAHGTRAVTQDVELKGAAFEIWMPFG